MSARAVASILCVSVLVHLGGVAALATAQASQWSETPVEIDGGPAPLRGTLAMPSGASLVPAVLILAGSGPTDRDGNLPGFQNDSLKLLAHGLTEHGIATLRVDKRGIGESAAAGGSERDLRFGTYVNDALRWVELLRREPRVGRVFLVGHSEGALIATLVAQRTALAGLALVSGSGSPAAAMLRRQLVAAGVPEPLRKTAYGILAHLEQGKLVSTVPAELAVLFRPSVQPYLISWLALDPVEELAKVSAPILVIQGSTDFQSTRDDAKRLARSRTGTELLLLDGVNHVLKNAPLDRAGNLATYSDPSLPLAPSVMPPIVSFIRSRGL